MSVPACFPTPFPLETLYSILCRYHVRSCNASDNVSLRQLFDKRRSLHTTVLSPFPMRFASAWTDSFHGFSRDELIREHTAFPYYQSFFSSSNISRSSYAADRFFMAMYNRCATFNKRLRYCPKCAQSQWETYGVAFWQILPQINGYEICLIHKEPIRETNITHKDIRYNFFPASNVLGKSKPVENPFHFKLLDLYWDKFLQLAEDINYLFQYSYLGFNLGDKIRKALLFDRLKPRPNWKDLVDFDWVLVDVSDVIDFEYLRALFDDPYAVISQIHYLPVCVQLRICRAIFGSVEEFCLTKI